jgi:glycine/D-amino acid oxidase-like deaminating enzyme
VPTCRPGISNDSTDVAVIGAGIAGIATAYYLSVDHKAGRVVLLDPRQPMSYTSAQSGDNYRNWWPHPVMTAFTSDSIDELERFAYASGDVFNMTRGGYVLATRNDDVTAFANTLESDIDIACYSGDAVQRKFPALADAIRNVVHVRRGGDISGQQLGTWMLEQIRNKGGRLLRAKVTSIDAKGDGFTLQHSGDGQLQTTFVINAAGPFAKQVAAMLGEELPVHNIFQQKVAFEDRLGAINRNMPFSIDLDAKTLDWNDEERELLAGDPDLRWLTDTLPGGTHCRPDGGPKGKWVKLGWAYNERESEPQDDMVNEPASDPQFPEIVMRGAAAFLPALKPYIENPPTRYSHYGGYYTMTEENWPLIGPMATEGAFMVAALSGFGSMSACAAGKLCAAWVMGASLPDYASALSKARYEDGKLMRALHGAESRGLL